MAVGNRNQHGPPDNDWNEIFFELEDLDEINPANDQYKIKVHVMRIWKSFKTLEMVLIDTEGTRIHASIEESLVKKIQHQFAVGDSIIIDTFDLVDYDDLIGQIVNVDSLENIKTKGKDNVKLNVDDFVQINTEPKSEQPKVTLYEEFFVLNEKMTIDDILYALEVRTCVTIAKISSVETLPKWYYIACNACNKKVQPYPLDFEVGKERLYSCDVCDKDVTELAQLLIGKKADELVAKIAEIHMLQDDPSTIPIAISSFIGKTMLFKVLITNDNLKSSKAAYVVEKFWEEEDMVVQFVKRAMQMPMSTLEF
ncbi:uncharacterized protein LOC111832383 [Capsella rubella]|uniref:uncharacterized protein LOC111832383 n=1 Tax=Capsella rubella TaxID=81985 RepID=UPI000CD56FEF|nr:uncharacterized protein LOC111832383 [Capsella rubella]